MTVNRAPAGLSTQGRRFWREMTGEYRFSPGELAILARAAHSLDRLAAMDAELATADLVIEGSTGQPKSNPLLASADSCERTFSGLIRDLALPLPSEREGKRRSPTAAMAARQRWNTGQVGV
jgi:hypothetical protein